MAIKAWFQRIRAGDPATNRATRRARGNLGRNVVIGPEFANVDFALVPRACCNSR